MSHMSHMSQRELRPSPPIIFLSFQKGHLTCHTCLTCHKESCVLPRSIVFSHFKKVFNMSTLSHMSQRDLTLSLILTEHREKWALFSQHPTEADAVSWKYRPVANTPTPKISTALLCPCPVNIRQYRLLGVVLAQLDAVERSGSHRKGLQLASTCG